MSFIIRLISILGILFIGMGIGGVLGGCSRPAVKTPHKHARKSTRPVPKNWVPAKRCTILGKTATANMAIIIAKDCMRPGLTTISILVLNPSKAKTAANSAAPFIIKTLGFKPKLTLLYYGRLKGYPFLLMTVTGETKRFY